MPKKAVEGGAGRRVALNMKTTEDVRARLEAAAAKSGRSLTAEVEHRLERSFQDDDRLEEVFGSRRAFAIMRLLAANIEALVNFKNPNADWTADAYLFDQAVLAINTTLQHLRPSGDVPEGAEALDYGGSQQGMLKAIMELIELRKANPDLSASDPAYKQLASMLRADLGDAFDRVPLTFGRTIAELPEAQPNSDEPAQDAQQAKGKGRKSPTE